MASRSRCSPETGELAAALEGAFSKYYGLRCRIGRLRRRKSVYSSSFTIENLDVELAGGRRLALVFKDLSPSSMLPTARRVRPSFLYEPRREIQVYREILEPERLGTPICYGAELDHEASRYWLFLERVSGPLLWQRGRIESWRQAARCCARRRRD